MSLGHASHYLVRGELLVPPSHRTHPHPLSVVYAIPLHTGGGMDRHYYFSLHRGIDKFVSKLQVWGEKKKHFTACMYVRDTHDV